jgi:hypothetical protein
VNDAGTLSTSIARMSRQHEAAARRATFLHLSPGSSHHSVNIFSGRTLVPLKAALCRLQLCSTLQSFRTKLMTEGIGVAEALCPTGSYAVMLSMERTYRSQVAEQYDTCLGLPVPPPQASSTQKQRWRSCRRPVVAAYLSAHGNRLAVMCVNPSCAGVTFLHLDLPSL